VTHDAEAPLERLDQPTIWQPLVNIFRTGRAWVVRGRELPERSSMPLQTVEIARADWPRTLEAFSAIHEGCRVSLEILSPEIGAQPEIADLPLVGTTFEPAHDGAIVIAAGGSAANQIDHIIRAPQRLWIAHTASGADAALEVESADGAKTILRLTTPVRPETVDGTPRQVRWRMSSPSTT
jgi:hypothetical protein